MSKPVEHRLQEAEAAKVALEADVVKLAAENDTYTKRMKEMEEAIAKAMEKMKAMEDKMEAFSQMKATLDEKMEQTQAALIEVEVKKEDEEESEDSEEAPTPAMEGNTLEGINEKVIAGAKKKGKKAKKAEEAPVEKVAEEVAPTPVAEVAPVVEKVAEQAPVEKVAEEVAPAPVAEEVKPETVAQEVVTATVTATVTPAMAPSIDINALVEAKVAEVAQKFASTLSKFSEMDSELIKSKEAKQVALASVADLQSKYEALLSKVSGIQSEAKTVEEKVAKTVASLGVEPVSNSPAEIANEVIEKTAEEILKEWSAMTDAKAKRAFYLKHQSTLVEATFPSNKKK